MGTTATAQDLLKLDYDYGNSATNNGSLQSQQITVPTVGANSGFTVSQSYGYDALNRLTSATETAANSQTWKQTFTYDRYGNRRFDAANTTTLGQSNSITNPTIDTANNRLTANQGYTYDAGGNLTQDAEGKQFAYDAENRQKTFGINNSATNGGEYFYDGEGKRVRKLVGQSETVFVYNAVGQLISEYELSSATPVNTTQYLTQDHLGSPRIVTDQSGNVVSRHDYTAFGEEAGSSQRVQGLGYAPDNVKQKYTGYERDAESGLDYAQARYYNARHGRFTSVDPLTASANVKDPQSFNRYSYGLNSPYKFTDPLGLRVQDSSGCGAEFSSCDGEDTRAPGEAAYEQRLETTRAQIAAQQAANRGDFETMWDLADRYGLDVQDKSRVEGINPDPVQAQQEINLASIFTDSTGIVRGGSGGARGNSINGIASHHVTPDGGWHTIHVYGADASGNTDANLYVPSGFTATYQGGPNNQVIATNKKTGEIIVYAHVKGVKSQKDLNTNLASKTNDAGSKFIGQTGGKAGANKGYMHSHITIYKNAAGRLSVMRQQNAPGFESGWGPVTDSRGYGDFRRFIAR